MGKNPRNNYNNNIKPKHILNDRITFNKVRLIGDNIEPKILNIEQARKIADDMNLDLMLVTDKGNPPVVRIVDYQKFLYQEKKKKEEQDKKQREHNKEMKEMRFSPNISEHDLETKQKKVEKFLKDGHKVKLDMRFKGRMMQNNKDVGESILLKMALELEDVSKPDSLPKVNGRNMFMILSPKN
jgi:translation initiation factor IF-3